MFKIIELATGATMECSTDADNGAYILNTFVNFYDMSKYFVLQTGANGQSRIVELRKI